MASVHFPAAPEFAPVVIFRRATVEIDTETAAVRQEEVDAAQAVAVYRRLEESTELLRDGAADHLEQRSIDELRQLACEFHVPERSKIVEKSELIAEIRRRM